MNRLQPISLLATKAATDPNMSMPPKHIETKNMSLAAIITFECRLYCIL